MTKKIFFAVMITLLATVGLTACSSTPRLRKVDPVVETFPLPDTRVNPVDIQ